MAMIWINVTAENGELLERVKVETPQMTAIELAARAVRAIEGVREFETVEPP